MTTTKQANGRYWTRFRVDGIPYAKRFDRRADGDAWEVTTKADLLRGTYIDPRGGKIPFEEYATTWQENQVQQRATTKARHDSNLRNHILPFFGDRSLDSIKRSHVQAFVNSLEGKLAPSTIRVNVAPLLSSILLSAVEDELIRQSPCRRINLPEDLGHPVIIPTIEMVEAIEEAFNPRWRCAVSLGAGAGTRIGECMGLTEDRIDLDGREILIDRQLHVVGKRLVISPVKTKAGERTVPITTRTVEALRAHLDEWPRGEAVTEDGEPVGGLIFTNTRGRGMLPQSWDPQWDRAVERSKVALPAGLRFHDLRHFFASALLRGGLSDVVVAKRMGHSSTNELKIYGHEWPDDVERTRAAIEAVLPPRDLRLVS